MSVELLGTARENGLKRLLVHHSYKLPLYGRGPAHVFSVHSCRFILYGQGPLRGRYYKESLSGHLCPFNCSAQRVGVADYSLGSTAAALLCP